MPRPASVPQMKSVPFLEEVAEATTQVAISLPHCPALFVVSGSPYNETIHSSASPLTIVQVATTKEHGTSRRGNLSPSRLDLPSH